MGKVWNKSKKYFLSGGLVGFLSGLLGGGGGALLVPLLTRWCKMEQQQALANSVAVILPICLLSVSLYWWQGELDVATSLPYLLGGGLGGYIGGKFFGKTNPVWLKRGFGLLLVFGGVRCFFS